MEIPAFKHLHSLDCSVASWLLNIPIHRTVLVLGLPTLCPSSLSDFPIGLNHSLQVFEFSQLARFSGRQDGPHTLSFIFTLLACIHIVLPAQLLDRDPSGPDRDPADESSLARNVIGKQSALRKGACWLATVMWSTIELMKRYGLRAEPCWWHALWHWSCLRAPSCLDSYLGHFQCMSPPPPVLPWVLKGDNWLSLWSPNVTDIFFMWKMTHKTVLLVRFFSFLNGIFKL